MNRNLCAIVSHLEVMRKDIIKNVCSISTAVCDSYCKLPAGLERCPRPPNTRKGISKTKEKVFKGSPEPVKCISDSTGFNSPPPKRKVKKVKAAKVQPPQPIYVQRKCKSCFWKMLRGLLIFGAGVYTGIYLQQTYNIEYPVETPLVNGYNWAKEKYYDDPPSSTGGPPSPPTPSRTGFESNEKTGGSGVDD